MSSVTIGAASHQGMVRNENQDAHAWYAPESGTDHKKGILLALADGMGGHSGGSIASRTAIQAVMETYYKDLFGNIRGSLETAVREANQKVYERSRADSSLKNMGTTLTAVVLQGERLHYAHVGDSRAYVLTDRKMVQITNDHSFVADLVRAGAISEEEARDHPERNIITRAVGINPDVEVDIGKREEHLQTGQFILICCDGLHGVVPEEQIVETIYSLRDPDPACRRLTELANEHGGPDNITVLLARVDRANVFTRIKSRIMGFVR